MAETTPAIRLFPGVCGHLGLIAPLAGLLGGVPIGLPEYGRDLPAMASTLWATPPPPGVVLVGASFGGLLAWATAQRHPQRVRAVVTIGSLPSRRFLSGRLIGMAHAVGRLPGSRRAHAHRTERLMIAEGFQLLDAKRWSGVSGAMGQWRARMSAIGHWGLSSPLPVPTLWLRGDADGEAPWTLDDARACLPGVDARLVPGGHRCHFTHARAVADEIRQFLSTTGSLRG